MNKKQGKSRWMSRDWKDFGPGDIICDARLQDNMRLIVHKDDDALWAVGFVHAAFTENCEIHPVYPMWARELEEGVYGDLLRLGNLDDYKEYLERVNHECKEKERFGIHEE